MPTISKNSSITQPIGIDATQAVRSITELKSAVKDATNEWKINEAQLKASGNSLGAAEAKYTGLTSAVKAQKDVIAELKTELSTLDTKRGTEAGEASWQKLNKQLSSAERTLGSYTNQMNKAETAFYRQKSGIDELSNSLKVNNDLTKSQVDLLSAQRNKVGAAKAELSGLNTSYEKQQTLLSAQVAELKRLETAEGTSSTAIAEQKAKVNEAGTALIGYRNKILEADLAVTKMHPFNDKNILGSGLNTLYQTSEKVTTAMSAGFEKVRQSAMMASFGIAAIGAVAIKGAQDASALQNQYKTTFNLLVTGGEQAAEAQKNVNKMQSEGADLSVKYGKTQKEIADGYQELVKRGYSSAQALGALPTMLQASVASGDDFTDVVHNSTAALESFGKKATDVTGMTKNTKEVVNEMAYAADMTATDFSSLGIAMEYVGATAHQNKLSLSETASAIGILSNNGLEADKAGTGLRKVMVSLQSPTNDAAIALSSIGLSTKDFVDQSGKMKSMTDIFGLLNQHTEKLSSFEQGQIFHALFGTTGQQAGSILSANVKQLGELNDKVKEAADGQGYVVRLANKNMQSTQNELKQFKAAGEAALIMIGQRSLPALTDAATSMAKAFNSKEGKQGLEDIADLIANIFQGTVDIVKFIGAHKQEVITIGEIFAGIWAVNKIGDALIMVKKINNELKIMSGYNALSNALAGRPVSVATAVEKEATTDVVAESETIASTATKTSIASNALSKVTSLIPKILGLVGSTTGSTVLSGGVNAGIELMSKDNSEQKAGGVLGSLSGAAAGAAIGSFFAPGIGTAIGAALGGINGSKIGKAFNKEISDMIKDASLKSEGYAPTHENAGPTQAAKDVTKQNTSFQNAVNTSAIIDNSKNSNIDAVANTTTTAYAKMGKGLDEFYSNQEKDSNKQIQTLLKNGAITQEQADNLLARQKNGDKMQRESQQKTLDSMQSNSTNYFKTVKVANDKYNSDSQAAEKSHAQKIKDIQSGNTDALKLIEQRYGKNSTEYRQAKNQELQNEDDTYHKSNEASEKAHLATLKKLQEDYAKKTTKDEDKFNQELSVSTKIAQNKQKDLLEEVKKSKSKLNAKQLQDVVEKSNSEYQAVVDSAKKAKDGSIKSANEKYQKTVEAADKERAENTSITKDQYDKMISKAKDARDSTVKTAKDGYTQTTQMAGKDRDDTVTAATDKADKYVKAAAKQAGESTKEYAKGFADTDNFYNMFIDGINNVLNFISKPFGQKWGSIKHVDVPKYATGTRGLPTNEMALVGEEGFELAHDQNRGIFPVGLQGPEVRPLQAGTSILPHSMSKKFLEMTADLPKHKDGVSGFLTDVWDTISNGPEKVINDTYNSLGIGKIIDSMPYSLSKVASGSGDILKDDLTKFAKSFFDKAESEGTQNAPSGSGVQRWKDQVKEALKANGLSTSDSMVSKVLRQIATESGGNPSAVQHGYTDANTISGDLAKGLMQTISSTFNAYKFPGHGNIFNGYDNLLAALAYAKARYGSNLSYLGQGHGYENGGIVANHGFVEVAEGNKAEMIIPLDPQKKSRATQLLNQATKTIKGNESSSNNDIASALNQAVTLLSSLLGINQQQLTSLNNQPPVRALVDGQSFAKGLVPYMQTATTDFQARQSRLGGNKA
ncbi:phage tail tape measure protein [Lactovum miscens]|uniref:TP901 family phage tail tape measure protein n=1 Tax=Lactovum miscens TaxID=190387 RepID=A0A841C867_9LACT|nr:phage tail tape measure protein [Lactovum miscens]MBB5887751.1 TP901 family phage tail tape measure protein [Lactovum miscens]